jgi:hypothetical protein
MPLKSGKAAKTRAGFSYNVKQELAEKKPLKQAIAIAYSKAGEKKRPKK